MVWTPTPKRVSTSEFVSRRDPTETPVRGRQVRMHFQLIVSSFSHFPKVRARYRRHGNWYDALTLIMSSFLFVVFSLNMSEGSQTPATIPVSGSFSSISLEDDAPMCRICHNTGGNQDGQETLRRVCWCKGTMGEVHKSCLERWLTAVHSDRCPICHYQFQTRRVYKPIRQVRIEFVSIHC